MLEKPVRFRAVFGFTREPDARRELNERGAGSRISALLKLRRSRRSS